MINQDFPVKPPAAPPRKSKDVPVATSAPERQQAIVHWHFRPQKVVPNWVAVVIGVCVGASATLGIGITIKMLEIIGRAQ